LGKLGLAFVKAPIPPFQSLGPLPGQTKPVQKSKNPPPEFGMEKWVPKQIKGRMETKEWLKEKEMSPLFLAFP